MYPTMETVLGTGSFAVSGYTPSLEDVDDGGRWVNCSIHECDPRFTFLGVTIDAQANVIKAELWRDGAVVGEIDPSRIAVEWYG